LLTQTTLGPFKKALTDAFRTTDQQDKTLAPRFIDMNPGNLDLLQAKVNQLLTGRRGVGKSTTFAVFQQSVEQQGAKVIFVDVESHKLRAYPDVLIELITDILGAVQPRWAPTPSRLKARKDIRAIIDVLSFLRQAGPELTQQDELTEAEARNVEVALHGEIAKKFMKLSAAGSSNSYRSTNRKVTTGYTKRKEEFLRDLASSISDALNSAASFSRAGSLFVVLDDFYMIQRANQPHVLDHLHGMTKRTHVWLKIASVGARTQTYINGDPPIGMQPPGDLQPMSLDVGLASFHSAKSFLEAVTDGVLKPLALTVADTLTTVARERAVLVAGGAVCRDYFEVLVFAADVAWNRVQGEGKGAEPFRIESEDILGAAGQLFDRKLDELRADAGLDAPALERRLDDILKFVRSRDDTYFVLVRREHLDTEWGREVIQLQDLKFLHRITTARPNTEGWRGVDTVVFMVDIPALVKNRMRKAVIEFWKPGEADKLRRATWVYEDRWQPVAHRKQATPRAHEPAHDEEGAEEMNLQFDFGESSTGSTEA
jgi:hypothetical protein